MYQKLSEKERQQFRDKFRENQIYRILYTPLWRQRGDDLSPVDVWVEANRVASKIKNESDGYESSIIQEIFEELTERYSIFVLENDVQITRSYSDAEHSAMMVSTVVFFLLLNIYPDAENHPYKTICKSIYDIITEISGFKKIYEEARRLEDESESRGEFIEVADFIEQIAFQEQPLDEMQLNKFKKVLDEFVEENVRADYSTMIENERLLSRVNDKNNHCIQPELDKLRNYISLAEGNERQNLQYENLIFREKHADRITQIRQAIYPYVFNDANHINKENQNEWLAIIEPLRLIDDLLIVHEEKKARKNCTDREICEQLKIFYEKEIPTLNFENIPKSISAERKKWKNEGVGLTFEDWSKFIMKRDTTNKYIGLVTIARKVYGEVKKVIKRL